MGVNAGVNPVTNSSLKCKNILWGNTNIGAAAGGKCVIGSLKKFDGNGFERHAVA